VPSHPIITRPDGLDAARQLWQMRLMTRKMTDAQLDYERKRAAKANMSLDQWLKSKATQEAKAAPKNAPPPKPKKKGLLSRLIDRANKPL
jgi:hypothetical protein